MRRTHCGVSKIMSVLLASSLVIHCMAYLKGSPLACVTDASIGKAFPFRTTGAKASGTQGPPVVAAGHTERAWGYNAGLPIDRRAWQVQVALKRCCCDHRRRLQDAIVLVNAPHTLLSADNRVRRCVPAAARPDLVSL